MYEFVITDVGATLSVNRAECSGRDEALRYAAALNTRQGLVFVAHIVGHVDHGNFYAWYNDDIAHVRLDEHREPYASDPSRPSSTDNPIGFHHEDGEIFDVPSSQVISRVQASEALSCWLATGKMLPSLSWSCATL